MKLLAKSSATFSPWPKFTIRILWPGTRTRENLCLPSFLLLLFSEGFYVAPQLQRGTRKGTIHRAHPLCLS